MRAGEAPLKTPEKRIATRPEKREGPEERQSPEPRAPKGPEQRALPSVDPALTRLRDRLRAELHGRTRDATVEELVLESRPLLEVLCALWDAPDDTRPSTAAEQEALSFASLLGRRAAELGLIPSLLPPLMPAIFGVARDASTRAERHSTARLEARATEALLEGYVASLREAAFAARDAKLAETVSVLPLGKDCLMVFLAGDQGGAVGEVLDALARRALEDNVRAILVSADRLGRPSAEAIRALFELHVACRMLGVDCVYAGLPDPWVERARDIGMKVDELREASTFEEGLRELGFELRERRGHFFGWGRRRSRGM